MLSEQATHLNANLADAFILLPNHCHGNSLFQDSSLADMLQHGIVNLQVGLMQFGHCLFCNDRSGGNEIFGHDIRQGFVTKHCA
jgi:hypothetical protein